MKVCAVDMFAALQLTSFSQFAILILAALATVATASAVEVAAALASDLEARVRTYSPHHDPVPCSHLSA